MWKWIKGWGPFLLILAAGAALADSRTLFDASPKFLYLVPILVLAAGISLAAHAHEWVTQWKSARPNASRVLRVARHWPYALAGVFIIGALGGFRIAYLVIDKAASEKARTTANATAPKPTVLPRAPIQVKWPPTIAYGPMAGPKKELFVDFTLINNTPDAIHISTYGAIALHTPTKDAAETVAILGNVKTEVHREATIGGGAVIDVPEHSDQQHFSIISGATVSEQRWLNIQGNQEQVYFYALILETFKDGSQTSTPICGIGAGYLVNSCPVRIDRGRTDKVK